MSENKHTAEPWSVRFSPDSEDCFITAAKEGRMAYGPEIMGDDYTGYGDAERKQADARRIVACVNACAGMPNEVLEAPGYSIKAELDSLDAQIAGRMKAEVEREQYRICLDALQKVALGVSSKIDFGMLPEDITEALCFEITRARAVLGILPEQKVIAFSCGFCGAPLNADREQVDAPEGYDPKDYQHDACGRCQAERDEPRYVTHEMALDAGDPSLEGTQW